MMNWIKIKCECGAELTCAINNEVNEIRCIECLDIMMVSVNIKPKNAGTTTYRNETWLRHEYENNGNSMARIAQDCGVSPMTIQNWLNTHSIETRSRGRKKKSAQ